jgi:hypothetical protein
MEWRTPWLLNHRFGGLQKSFATGSNQRSTWLELTPSNWASGHLFSATALPSSPQPETTESMTPWFRIADLVGFRKHLQLAPTNN